MACRPFYAIHAPVSMTHGHNLTAASFDAFRTQVVPSTESTSDNKSELFTVERDITHYMHLKDDKHTGMDITDT